MAQKKPVDRIWWLTVQPGEFYNIERFPRIKGGGGGSLYIEIPGSMVAATLDFLDATGANVDALPVITIHARVIGKPEVSGPIKFHPKSGGRMRISCQNRQQEDSQRHPAWTAARGFPTAPNNVGSTDEALAYLPDGGLRIYIAKTVDGEYFAGFKTGARPTDMEHTDPNRHLYLQERGGVINAN